MSGDDLPLRLEVTGSIHTVAQPAWDACTDGRHPFVEHAFLATLEDSGAIGEGTGWYPRYILARLGDEHAPILGIAPLFARTDSYGEYIFDWAWANGAQRAGLAYYPKLTAAVPFTPATGPRMLIHPDAPTDLMRQALGQGAVALAQEMGASGVHWLFCSEQEATALHTMGYSHRKTYQFHWENQGYSNFDAFLGALSRKRRKEIRRERKRAREHGFRIETKTGNQLTVEDWRGLRSFYLATHADRPYQRQYLPAAWWGLAGERLADHAIAVLVYDGSRPIAGSLSFRGSDTLYGRYWGSLGDWDALHFECCYYALIEYAIDHGLSLFEAGAQGEHKLRRGLLPRITHSAHHILHPGLHDAIAGFIQEETLAVRRDIAILSESSPYAT